MDEGSSTNYSTFSEPWSCSGGEEVSLLSMTFDWIRNLESLYSERWKMIRMNRTDGGPS